MIVITKLWVVVNHLSGNKTPGHFIVLLEGEATVIFPIYFPLTPQDYVYLILYVDYLSMHLWLCN